MISQRINVSELKLPITFFSNQVVAADTPNPVSLEMVKTNQALFEYLIN